jgi:putative Mg2+ transporter-C (MgtC) family protein
MPLDELLAGLRTHISEAEILLRLVLASLLGAVIGLDRELRDRPAGLRTHMLTATAAAMFSILTLELYHDVKDQSGEAVGADPIRIVEAVTAGVAFLAAGAIIHGRGTVHGLTTGAGMWLAGAIGVACGIGHYSIALMAAVLALVILTLVRLLAAYLPGNSGGREP